MTTAPSLEQLARLITRSAALGRGIQPQIEGPAPSAALRGAIMELAKVCSEWKDRSASDWEDGDDGYEEAFAKALRRQDSERDIQARVHDLLRTMTEDAVVSGGLGGPHQRLVISIAVLDRTSPRRTPPASH